MISRVQDFVVPITMSPPAASQEHKQQYVRRLFDGIAPRYDFLNHFLSSGFDILWRRKAVGFLRDEHPGRILDVATGTADVAIEAARTLDATVQGIDISGEMLKLAKAKVSRFGLVDRVLLELGEAESLRFQTDSFDAATVAFGVRNFADVDQGLAEILRVLRPNGTLVILEFSRPRTFPFRQLYGFYFRRVLPVIGGIVSKKKESYEYLPHSVMEFPDGDEFLDILTRAGFANTRQHTLSLGIATIYTGKKPG